ncbi:hypothetical protein GLGCALEP_05555 [Pseudomonas sp. MM221]|nr:hypothetical protein GLGCALEP_05555 [Pseudomonas sp. MM221]
MPVLGQVLQLFGGRQQQAFFVAVAQAAAKLRCQPLLRQAMAVLFAFAQQVTNIEHLQQPAIGLPLEPATGVQGRAEHGRKIKVQWLPLPVGGEAFKHQPALPLQVVMHTWGAV